MHFKLYILSNKDYGIENLQQGNKLSLKQK
jgi:hypothetical protein